MKEFVLMEAYEFSSFGKEMVDVNESDYKLWLCYLLMSTKAFSIVPCVEQMLKMCLLVGKFDKLAALEVFLKLNPNLLWGLVYFMIQIPNLIRRRICLSYY